MPEVTFSNYYFEALDSIEIENQKVGNIDMGENITLYNICAGNYNISIITQSGLKLKATFSLTGSNPVVRITITETGKLILE
ncbi:hypothetical protein AGMMS50267_18310 [Spirochaetia bacterium]|nr:hypothetical protein AGMMS50267_18310 [Spirochaetia bacterium]